MGMRGIPFGVARSLAFASVFCCQATPIDPSRPAEPVDVPAITQRLVERQWQAEGTAAWTLETFDRERRHACAFGIATDGKLRCLPTADAPSSTSAFADPDCTRPIFARGNELEPCNESPDSEMYAVVGQRFV